MNSVITEIYNGNICGNNIKLPKNAREKENTLYEKLICMISEEAKAILEKYLEVISDNSEYLLKETYLIAFKTGLFIGFETAATEEL